MCITLVQTVKEFWMTDYFREQPDSEPDSEQMG